MERRTQLLLIAVLVASCRGGSAEPPPYQQAALSLPDPTSRDSPLPCPPHPDANAVRALARARWLEGRYLDPPPERYWSALDTCGWNFTYGLVPNPDLEREQARYEAALARLEREREQDRREGRLRKVTQPRPPEVSVVGPEGKAFEALFSANDPRSTWQIQAVPVVVVPVSGQEGWLCELGLAESGYLALVGDAFVTFDIRGPNAATSRALAGRFAALLDSVRRELARCATESSASRAAVGTRCSPPQNAPR